MTTEGKSLFVHTCIKITIKRKIKKLIYIKSTVDFVGLDTFDSENYFVIENLKINVWLLNTQFVIVVKNPKLLSR